MIPETMTTRITVITSIGPSGEPPVVIINNSTFTAPRLSGTDSLPLISRMTVSSVSRSLNGTVVKCFEGSSSTVSVATTTIYIIGGENVIPVVVLKYYAYRLLNTLYIVFMAWLDKRQIY